MAHGRQPKPKPLYQNVMDDILTAIDSGGFSFDKPICTESGLMDKYGYSRITVRRALDELENMGALYRKRGVGSFVSRDSYLSSKEDSVSVAGKLFAFIWPFNISRTSLAVTFQSANDYLLAHGCYGSVFITEDEGEKKSSMVLSRLAHTDVAGIAYYPLKNDIHIDLLNPFVFKNRPVVIMDMPSGCSYLPSVTSDNAGGSLKLMEHLTMPLGAGRSPICPGHERDASAPPWVDRIAGYLAGRWRGGPADNARLYTYRRNCVQVDCAAWRAGQPARTARASGVVRRYRGACRKRRAGLPYNSYLPRSGHRRTRPPQRMWL